MIRMRVLLTVVTTGSSLASFVAYVLLLRYLGATAEVDLLFYAGSMPMAVSGMAAGVLLYLLPPQMTRLSRRHQDTATRALTLMVAVTAAIAMAAGLVGGLFQPERQLFWLLCTGFTLFAGLSLTVVVLSCLAQSRGDYIATGWAQLAMGGGLFAGAMMAIALRQAFWVLIGQLIGSLAASQWLAWRLDLSWRGLGAKRQQAIAALRPLRRSLVPITLGTAAFTLFQPLDAWLCQSLGDGALATMSFAQRVLVAVSTVVSLGSYVIAAKLSRDTLRDGGVHALRHQAIRETFRLVAAGLVAWLAYLLFGRMLLKLLLESHSMQAQDLDRLLSVLGWMLIGIGPMAAMPYLCRVLYSMKAFKLPALIGLLVPAGYLVTSLTLMPWLNIYALPVAYIFVWWGALIASIIALNRV